MLYELGWVFFSLTCLAAGVSEFCLILRRRAASQRQITEQQSWLSEDDPLRSPPTS